MLSFWNAITQYIYSKHMIIKIPREKYINSSNVLRISAIKGEKERTWSAQGNKLMRKFWRNDNEMKWCTKTDFQYNILPFINYRQFNIFISISNHHFFKWLLRVVIPSFKFFSGSTTLFGLHTGRELQHWVF